jgi:hypothetical protein
MSFAAINVAGGSEASTGRGYTGLDGNVTFRVLPDEYQFPPEILGEADDHITVFCAGKDELQDPLEYPVDVVAKDHIVCDLYLLPAALNGRTGSDPLKSVVASLTVHSCDTSGCATPVEGFAMRFRTEPSNNVRLVTDANGYAEAAFSYEAAGGVLIVPEFNDFDRHTPVGQADISCVSSGVELPRTALESPSANQMFALKTAEVADIDCTILLNVDLVEI